MDNDFSYVGHNIRHQRQIRNMTLEDVVDALRKRDIVTTFSRLAKLERGDLKMDVPTLMALGDVLDVHPTILLMQRDHSVSTNGKPKLELHRAQIEQSARDVIQARAKLDELDAATTTLMVERGRLREEAEVLDERRHDLVTIRDTGLHAIGALLVSAAETEQMDWEDWKASLATLSKEARDIINEKFDFVDSAEAL